MRFTGIDIDDDDDGTVTPDEAFDKADTALTRMAVDVFLEFGST